MVSSLTGAAADPAALRDEVLALSSEWVEEQRRRAAEEVAEQQRVRVDRLRRRVAKLVRTLDEFEERLKDAPAPAEAEPGLPSVYRDVQGLDSDDRSYQQKKALMTQIFEANLSLQGQSPP